MIDAHGYRQIGGLGRVLAACLTMAAIAAPAHAQLAFQASEDPSRVVIQLTQDVGIEGDDTPMLRIYGDGRVLVHFPVYMRRAGDYSLQLDPAALNGLLRTFVGGGLVDFNPESVKSEIQQVGLARRQAALQTGDPVTVTTRSDDTLVSLTVQLDSYTGADGAARQDVSAGIAWAGVQHDARDFPGVVLLQRLAAFERQLVALTEHPDLVRVSP